MKTVKTAEGIKRIEDWDATLIPVQLQEILQECRAAIIKRIIAGLSTYITFKFNYKARKKELVEIRKQLYAIKHSALNLENYHVVLEQVLKYDTVVLDSTIFYLEIDNTIKCCINGEVRVKPFETPVLNRRALVVSIRKDFVNTIQTEKGLQGFVENIYDTSITDKAKMSYLLEELREHFKSEPQNYLWLHERLEEMNVTDPLEGNYAIITKEVKEILDKHFQW